MNTSPPPTPTDCSAALSHEGCKPSRASQHTDLFHQVLGAVPSGQAEGAMRLLSGLRLLQRGERQLWLSPGASCHNSMQASGSSKSWGGSSRGGFRRMATLW